MELDASAIDSPLALIALFVAMIELFLIYPIGKLQGRERSTLIAFVIFYPTFIASVFFIFLWNKPINLYAPHSLSSELQEALISDQLKHQIQQTDQDVITQLFGIRSELSALKSGVKENGEVKDKLKYKRILWVDDHPANNTALVKFLKKHDVTVTQVRTTDQAINALSINTFDAVISDMGRIELPSTKKNSFAGIDLVTKLSKLYPAIPVYFYSSRTDLAQQAQESGAKLLTSSANTLLTILGF